MGYVSGISGMGYLGADAGRQAAFNAASKSFDSYMKIPSEKGARSAYKGMQNNAQTSSDFAKVAQAEEALEMFGVSKVTTWDLVTSPGYPSSKSTPASAATSTVKYTSTSSGWGTSWAATPVRVHQTWYDTGKLASNTRIANGWYLNDTGSRGIQLVNRTTGAAVRIDGTGNPHPLSRFQDTTIVHEDTGKILYQSGTPDGPSSASNSSVWDTIGSGITSLFSAAADVAPQVAPHVAKAIEDKRAATDLRRNLRTAQQETQEARAGLPGWAIPVAGVAALVAIGYLLSRKSAPAAPVAQAAPELVAV